ncbi:MAG: NAD-dependent epimerase/dehydratase family protein, partial [Candidatus Eremiobacteraeota bacterium]|nr:NAD-dependent epimerase/dehydratase family protein [Candidatus Eremiobacteraeota bacterium]
MKVTIIGASGFVGSRLAVALRAQGATVVPASLRDIEAAARACDGADAVVNLAGENVAQRWSKTAKERIRASRVDAPRALIERFSSLRTLPKAYVSASAIGYYGTSETATFTEASPAGDDFLAQVCVE